MKKMQNQCELKKKRTIPSIVRKVNESINAEEKELVERVDGWTDRPAVGQSGIYWHMEYLHILCQP